MIHIADLVAIRTALAAQITAHTGLRADGQARDSITVPCAVVLPGQPLIDYAVTTDGALTINLVVLLLISDAPPVEMTQRALDSYLGVGAGASSTSLPAAIEYDQTLGGLIHYMQAVNVTSYGRVEYSSITYFGARVSVLIGAI